MKREVIGCDSMDEMIANHSFNKCPFFFSSPTNTLLGSGIEQSLEQVIPFRELAGTAQQLLNQAKKSEMDNPVLFGLVPFSEGNPTRFIIPQHLYASGTPRALPGNVPAKSKALLVSSPSGEKYKQGVMDALDLFSSTELSKVVLSRAIEIEAEKEIDRSCLLKNLLKVNPRGYTFSASLNQESSMIGASPELLVAKRGAHLISNPLAGSRPRSENEVENARERQYLLNCTKELHEHQLVVEEVERVLSQHCHNLYTPMVPSVIETNSMLHLSTCLEGHAVNPQISVLQIASELHPTPAVCGFPRQSAYQAICDIEQYDRGYFTGMVGWCDARGNGEWVVTIRCAEVNKRLMKVYAGAGIVTQSRPESELHETGAKMGTILSAAGIELEDMLVA
ncbi:isochorismate synthase [Vibrio aerogenes]|nr:isochorismate synthase [Vibrio aerogenes]